MTLVPRLRTAALPTGIQLHVAEQGDSNGNPMLLVHGWPDSWFTFSRVLPLLSPHLRVIAPDLRGFGDSSRPDGRYAIADLADDLVHLCDALSIAHAAVVGHSFGSFVARRMAIAHPGRVSKLVLIGSGLTAANAVTRNVQEAIRDLPDPVPLAFAREFQASTAYLPLPHDFFEGLVTESVKIPAPIFRALFDGLLDYEDAAQLGRIRAPVMLVWGDRDELFPRGDQDRLAAAIPDAILKVYKDTGHCPNWERPEKLVDDLHLFLLGEQPPGDRDRPTT